MCIETNRSLVGKIYLYEHKIVVIIIVKFILMIIMKNQVENCGDVKQCIYLDGDYYC